MKEVMYSGRNTAAMAALNEIYKTPEMIMDVFEKYIETTNANQTVFKKLPKNENGERYDISVCPAGSGGGTEGTPYTAHTIRRDLLRRPNPVRVAFDM